MNVEKRETYASGSSDGEGADSGAEDSPPAATTLPKKRGRPAKGEKVVKPPSGRGRGRPAKIANPIAEGSEDSDVAVENGKKAAGGKGRPAKNGKPIVATGKGRGRPKNATKRAAEDGEETSPKKDKGTAGKRGRPRKAAQASDEEVSVEEEDVEVEDEEEVETDKRKVGRPHTGAVQLNIVRTGRGQGRPKKRVAAKAYNGPPRKRGRPAAAKKVVEETNDVDSKEDDVNSKEDDVNSKEDDVDPKEDDVDSKEDDVDFKVDDEESFHSSIQELDDDEAEEEAIADEKSAENNVVAAIGTAA